MAQRISPNPVWQLIDQGGDIIASINNDGSSSQPVGQAQGVASFVNQMRFVVSSAQLLALKTTPVSLIPAPGAGKMIQVLGCDMRIVFGGTAYTLNAGTLKVFYGPVANAKAITGDQSALLTQIANATTLNAAISAETTLTDAQALNVDVELGNDGAANYTLGNGTLVVYLEYEIWAA